MKARASGQPAEDHCVGQQEPEDPAADRCDQADLDADPERLDVLRVGQRGVVLEARIAGRVLEAADDQEHHRRQDEQPREEEERDDPHP